MCSSLSRYIYSYLHFKYRTRVVITSVLYLFHPILHCGLYCRAVSVTDNLCTKQGNSSIFGSRAKLRVDYKGVRTVLLTDIYHLEKLKKN